MDVLVIGNTDYLCDVNMTESILLTNKPTKNVKWIHTNWNYKEVKKSEMENGKLRRTLHEKTWKNERDNNNN